MLHRHLRADHRAAARRSLIDRFGLDPARRLLPGVTDPFVAVSDQRMILGRQGGFRFKPKDELLSLERSAFRVVWWDEAHPGPDERHIVVQISDGGWWDTSSIVSDNYNSNALLQALGPNAVHAGA